MKVEYRLRDLRWENCMGDYYIRNGITFPYSWFSGIRFVNDGDKWIAEKILILGDEDEN